MVVRGRLWRLSNPGLSPHDHSRLVHDLMVARRAVKDAGADKQSEAAARHAVNVAKIALGDAAPFGGQTERLTSIGIL